MEILSWIVFGPAKLIALFPYAGFVVGGIFLAGRAIQALRLRGSFNREWFRHSAALAGLVWLIFNLYELQVGAVFGKQHLLGPSLLRIDLMVITPILYVLTVAAVCGGGGTDSKGDQRPI